MEEKVFFISHSTEEKKVALLLKKLIQKGNAKAEIFCSSDYESLPKGKEPMNEIFQALDSSTYLLVIVSAESQHKQWINFETGYFYHKRKSFHVICIGDFPKGSMTGPLSMLQATALSDVQDIKQLLSEIGLIDIDGVLLSQLIEEGEKHPFPKIKIQPYILPVCDRPNIALLIQNHAGEAKDFSKAILKVPANAIFPNWGSTDMPPTLHWETKKNPEGGTFIKVGTLISSEVTTPWGYPPVLRPEKSIPQGGELDSQEYYLRIPLKDIENHSDVKIEYEVTVGGRIFSGCDSIGNLPVRDQEATLRPGAMVKYVVKPNQVPKSLKGSVVWKFYEKVDQDSIALDECGIEYRLKDPKGDMVLVKRT